MLKRDRRMKGKVKNGIIKPKLDLIAVHGGGEGGCIGDRQRFVDLWTHTIDAPSNSEQHACCVQPVRWVAAEHDSLGTQQVLVRLGGAEVAVPVELVSE